MPNVWQTPIALSLELGSNCRVLKLRLGQISVKLYVYVYSYMYILFLLLRVHRFHIILNEVHLNSSDIIVSPLVKLRTISFIFPEFHSSFQILIIHLVCSLSFFFFPPFLPPFLPSFLLSFLPSFL